MIHRFSQNVQAGFSFDAVLANSTQNGTGVDTLGYRRAAVIISGWTGSATTLNFSLSDSPDNSTFTAIAGTSLGSAVSASTVDAGPYLIDVDLSKRQRYLRANIIGTGAAGNASAVILLYEPSDAYTIAQTNAVISI